MKLIVTRFGYEYDISAELDDLWAEIEIEHMLEMLESRVSDNELMRVLMSSPWEEGVRQCL